MKFYKILDETECHNGLQYKTGLNIDPIPFNPSGDCEPGGIYYAREDILYFLDYGPWIREVTLPDDARTYLNPRLPVKWKADKVILGERRRINDEVIEELLDEGAKKFIKVFNLIETEELFLRLFNLYYSKDVYGHIVMSILIKDRPDFLIHYLNKVKPCRKRILEQAVYHNSVKIVKFLLNTDVEPTTTARLLARQGSYIVRNLILKENDL